MVGYKFINALLVSVIGGLVVALIILAITVFRKWLKVRRHRHSGRGIVFVDREGVRMRGCQAVHRESHTRTEDKSDATGFLPIPPSWPEKFRICIEYLGRTLIIDIEVDFSESKVVTLTLPIYQRGDYEKDKDCTPKPKLPDSKIVRSEVEAEKPTSRS